MNIIISAPHPAYASIIVLPQPQLGDVERLNSNVVVGRTITNQMYSYIVTQPNQRSFIWSFDLTRLKALELNDFINMHSHHPWHIKWDTDSYVCQLQVNPFELNMVSRGVLAGSEETVSIDLELLRIQ